MRFTQGHDKPIALVNRSYLSQVQEVERAPDTGDAFGTPTGGKLRMTGLLGRATWEGPPDEEHDCRLFLEGLNAVAGNVEFDEDFDAGRPLPPPRVWVLPVLQGAYVPWEIVINPNPGGPRKDSPPPRELVLEPSQEADEGENAQEHAGTVAQPPAHERQLEQDEDDGGRR